MLLTTRRVDAGKKSDSTISVTWNRETEFYFFQYADYIFHCILFRKNKIGRWVISRTITNCLVTSSLGILLYVTESVHNLSYVML